MNEARPKQDAAAETKQDGGDGSFPEVPLAFIVIWVYEWAELERKNTEEKWDYSQKRHCNDLHLDQVHFVRISLKTEKYHTY